MMQIILSALCAAGALWEQILAAPRDMIESERIQWNITIHITA